VLLIGEPGFGKTTAAKVMGSIFGGYPFDLYESAQFQGNPEQTLESLVGRLDFSRLTTEEKVIWQMGLYLPLILLDEINRLPGGKQDVMLNGVDTGRFAYLNDTFFDGKKPFFATANHPDDGNHVIIPPLADRFALCIELGDQGPYANNKIRIAEENIKSDLWDTELTEKILNIINDKKLEVKEKFKKMDAARQTYIKKLESNTDVKRITEEEAAELKKAIYDMQLSPEAAIFLDCIRTELNYGGRYGRKRSCDAIDDSTHMNNIASTKVKRALSPRGVAALEDFAKSIAFYIGANKVEKEHIVAVAPYVLQHRMEFTDDFKAEHEESNKFEENDIYWNAHTVQGHLVKELIEGIDANYRAAIKDKVALLYTMKTNPANLTPEQKKEAKKLAEEPLERLDHPLLKAFVYEIRR